MLNPFKSGKYTIPILTQVLTTAVFPQFLLMQISLATPYYDYKVINSYPHSTKYFTQGLVISEGIVYESTGQYGKSKLIKYTPKNGEILKQRKLSGRYFGEGLTILDNKIYQLTWKSGNLFVYDKKNLQKLYNLKIDGEGWGLTNNGKQLIYSNGGTKLHFISPENGEHQKTIIVRDKNGPVALLNELEWIDKEIYANIWHSNDIIIIDPESGKVLGRINLSKLATQQLNISNPGVLNGIAYDKKQKHLFITGKNWPFLYEISLKTELIDNIEFKLKEQHK